MTTANTRSKSIHPNHLTMRISSNANECECFQDLRSETKVKEEVILGDKAVGGMDNDKDHMGNVIGGLKA